MSKRIQAKAYQVTLLELHYNRSTYINKLPFDLIRYLLLPIFADHVARIERLCTKYCSILQIFDDPDHGNIIFYVDLLLHEPWHCPAKHSIQSILSKLDYCKSASLAYTVLDRIANAVTPSNMRTHIVNLIVYNNNSQHMVEWLIATHPSLFDDNFYHYLFLTSIGYGCAERCGFLLTHCSPIASLETRYGGQNVIDAIIELILTCQTCYTVNTIAWLYSENHITNIALYSDIIWQRLTTDLFDTSYNLDLQCLEYIHDTILPMTSSHKLAMLRCLLKRDIRPKADSFLYKIDQSADLDQLVESIEIQACLTAPQSAIVKKLVSTYVQGRS